MEKDKLNELNKEKDGVDTENQSNYNKNNHDVKNLKQEGIINKNKSNIDTMKNNRKDRDHVNPSEMKEKGMKIAKEAYKKVKATTNSEVQISSGNLIFPVLFLIGTLTYLELIIHLLIYRSISIKIIYPILFSVPFGIFIGFITGWFKPIVNKIIMWIVTFSVCLIFGVQLIYFYIFKTFFSFQTIGMAGDALTEFSDQVISAIIANMGGIILVFIPLLILGVIFNRFIDYSRRTLKVQGVLLGTGLMFHVVAVVALLFFGKGDYSPYDLYHSAEIPTLCAKDLGITTMTRIDVSRLILGNDELTDTMNPGDDIVNLPTNTPAPNKNTNSTDVTNMPSQPPIDSTPNVMNIDFKGLASKENNKTLKSLNEYFASVTPTNKNKYTGMFKGYNLIQITAEGFFPGAINKELTPTLYKLTHEGFVFNNYYCPLWQTSTSDGEYANLLGIIPTGTRSMFRGRNNAWPLNLAKQFDKLGVKSRAYHDHTYTYYQRNETHPNLGYNFKAKGNGLELEHPNTWPESDIEMMNATVDEYAKDEPFHVYYLTVSGHMNYTFTGNYISYKNRDLVKDLPFSDTVKAYISCQIELDRALKVLIEKLEAAGVADRTVIALSADHYPYAWDKETIDEAIGHDVEKNFEMFKNNLILWNKGMKENVVIDKPCYSLDILPTLSNLFGIEYDSRLLVGQDILSDSPPLVIFSNRSYITDKIMYNSETRDVTNLTDETLPEDYVSMMNKIVRNKFVASENILKEDYYKYIFKNSK